MTPDVWIVIPARNESRRLPATLERLASFLDDHRDHGVVVAVDAHSTDDTAEIATEFADRVPRARSVSAVGGSKWLATLDGVRVCDPGVVVTADADLSVPPDAFGGLVEAARSGALAIGSREIDGAARLGEPLGRRVLSRVFNGVVRAVALPRLRDTQCGFKAFGRDLGLDLLERVSVRGWAFDVELLALARSEDVPVVEVPVRWTYRPGGSVRPLRDAPSVAWDLWSIRRRYGRSPGQAPGEARERRTRR